MSKNKKDTPHTIIGPEEWDKLDSHDLRFLYSQAKNDPEKLYKDLIEVTEKTIDYSEKGLKALTSYVATSLKEQALVLDLTQQLLHYQSLVRQVVCQTRRRVLAGESVPAQEKIVSIFEEHTDIIRKDRRDTYYGHKICVTGGASNLILDCVVLEGNPADSELTSRDHRQRPQEQNRKQRGLIQNEKK